MQTSQNEISVIGSLLISPEVLPIIERHGLTPEDFETKECRDVLQAAFWLRDNGKPIDITTLGYYANEQNGGDISQWLVEAMVVTPTAANIDEYCRIVKMDAKRRKFQSLLGDAADRMYYGDWQQEVDNVWQTLQETKGSAEDVITGDALSNCFLEYFKRAKEDPDNAYCRTGIADLDQQLGGGLFRSEVYIIGARPGMGKTTLGINIAQSVVDMGKRVLFVSLEMTEEQIQAKRISCVTGLPYTELLSGRLPSYSEATMMDGLQKMHNGNFFLVTQSGSTVGDILRTARQIEDLALIIVDYLGLIPVPQNLAQKQHYEQMTEISAQMKAVAKTLNIPVLALSQLNRENTMRSDKRPTLADLRDSGAIEQDAGGVILLHRPEYYAQNNSGEQKETEEIELHIAKSRHSSPGVVTMIWSGTNGRITQKGEQSAESMTAWAEGDELPF